MSSFLSKSKKEVWPYLGICGLEGVSPGGISVCQVGGESGCEAATGSQKASRTCWGAPMVSPSISGSVWRETPGGGLRWSVSSALASLGLPGGRRQGAPVVSVISPSISGSAWWESGFVPHLLFVVTASSHTAHMLDSYFRYCDNSLNSHQREKDKPSPVALK